MVLIEDTRGPLETDKRQLRQTLLERGELSRLMGVAKRIGKSGVYREKLDLDQAAEHKLSILPLLK